MSGSDRNRPYGDDAFEDPRRSGWVKTVLLAVLRSVTAVVQGSQGGQWPRQRPLDPPSENKDYRP